MAQESRTQVKTYFQTNDYPTEAQCVNLIDSAAWYDEVVPGKVLAPAGMASGSVGSQAIAANSLVTHIIITASGAGTVNIGTSSGGTQISAAEPYVNGTICFVANEAFTSSATLYFSGHSHTLTVKIITVSIA